MVSEKLARFLQRDIAVGEGRQLHEPIFLDIADVQRERMGGDDDRSVVDVLNGQLHLLEKKTATFAAISK